MSLQTEEVTRATRTRLRAWTCGVTLSATVASWSTTTALADGQMCLQALEAEVAQSYPAVPSMLPEELEQAMRSGQDAPLLVDVRERDEQRVSSLPGAFRISPGMSPEAFVTTFAEAARGRQVVLYCSVGVRSSKLANAVRDRMLQNGALGVRNLRGGIFAWHNTGRALVSGGDRTDFVHPYSRRWSTFVEFGNYARYAPDK